MKLLTKILMAVQLLATSAVWGDSCSSNNPNNLPNPAYERTDVIAAFLPSPLPFIDPGHQIMLNKFPGLYDQEDVDELHEEALDFFYNTFGVDFRPSTNSANLIPTPDGVGVIVLNPVTHAPIAVWFPIVFGAELKDALVVDTAHPSWTVTHYWFYFATQEGVSFISPYTVPAGFTQAGAQAAPGDILIFGYTDLLANGTDLSKPVNREQFETRSDQIIKRSPNEKNVGQFHNYLTIVKYDDNGEEIEGRYSAPTFNTIDPNDPNQPQTLYFPCFTFDCPGAAA